MKIPKKQYTVVFNEVAVTRFRECHSAGAVAKELGLIEQTLRNWVKAAAAGTLNGAGARWSRENNDFHSSTLVICQSNLGRTAPGIGPAYP